MALFLTIIVAVSLFLLAWAWVGYPLLLAGLARSARNGERGRAERGVPASPDDAGAIRSAKPEARSTTTERGEPRVSIIIAAHNEEKVIRARLDNLAAGKLPGNCEILLGCDGCDDRTAEIVKAWGAEHGALSGACGSMGVWECRSEGAESGVAGPESEVRGAESEVRVPARSTKHEARTPDNGARRAGESSIRLRLFEFAERRGKPAVLKDLVAASAGDILVFSDANTMFAEDAIPRLLAPLAEPEVGGVCGRLVFLDHGAAGRENFYWRFETWLKIRESAVDSCLGANGAIYALRRELFWLDLPSTAIIDDFVLGMKVRQQGKRMLYVPQAVAYEDLPATVGDEWRRRIRIGAGDYQAVGLCRGCLLPRHGFFALAFFSHKLLRWFTPHLMLVFLLASLAGLFWAGSFPVRLIFALLVAGQGLWYALALAGWASRSWLRAIYYFNAMQLALLCGFGRYLAGIRSGAWQRTAR